MTITATKPDEPQPNPFACSFCGRPEGVPGVDVVVVGPHMPSGWFACICNSCAASSVSSIRGIRMQRLARMKGKRKKAPTRNG